MNKGLPFASAQHGVTLWQLVLTIGLIFALCPLASANTRPNILLILADDLGFTDIAPYGSEIHTPNLDQLAQRGLRFSNYHTTASCAPTRAMLLTGVDSHRAGVANIEEALPPEQQHSPFYRGSLNHNVVTVARLLQDAGYHTTMAGKWHLGYADKSLRPINRGFDQTVMMPYSGGDNWTQQSYIPHYSKTRWFENGEEIKLPDNFYSSAFLVDKTIAQLEKNRLSASNNPPMTAQPFFTYLAFQAVHIPVQAPKTFTQKYLNTYQKGWDALRDQRQQAVKQLGLIRMDAPMKRMASTQDWNKLSLQEQRYNSKRMAVYAGMIEAMDFHIGRLLDYLKSIGELDNTVIIFTSDNGSEPSDPASTSRLWPLVMKFMGYNNDYETLGERYSYNSIGTSFASAAASPLGHFKFHSGEGGMRVPMIVAGPALASELAGQISHSKAFVKDISPTLLAIAGTQHPGEIYQGRSIEVSTGKNLLPLLSAETDSIYAADDVIAYEIGGNASLIKGDYKIILNRGKNNSEDDDGRWHLYNLKRDPGEVRPIERDHPALFSELLSDYENYARENGVIPVSKDYQQLKQILRNGIVKRLQDAWQFMLLGALLIFALILLLIFVRFRRGFYSS